MLRHSTMSRIFFVLDNRQISAIDFITDASCASYHRNITILIQKLIALSTSESFIRPPVAIAVAMSNSRVYAAQKHDLEFLNIPTLVEPKYLLNVCRKAVAITWSQYFVDALAKIGELARANSVPAEPIALLFFSTDIGLLGNAETEDLKYGIKQFIAQCEEIRSIIPQVIIKIWCVVVTESPGGTCYTNPNLDIVLSLLNQYRYISLTCLVNSSLYYDEALRGIISLSAPEIFSKIELPEYEGMRCSLMIRLKPLTTSAAGAIHRGLASPSLYSLVGRSDVNPMFLDGKGLQVSCPQIGQSDHLLPSIESYQMNQVIYSSLVGILARTDTLAILRVPHEPFDATSSTSVNEYWALVPPSSQQQSIDDSQQIVLIKLVDNDQLLSTSEANPIGHVKKRTLDDSDGDLINDAASYLTAALQTSLSTSATYDPRLFSAGRITNLYERVVHATSRPTNKKTTSSVRKTETSYLNRKLGNSKQPSKLEPQSKGLSLITQQNMVDQRHISVKSTYSTNLDLLPSTMIAEKDNAGRLKLRAQENALNLDSDWSAPVIELKVKNKDSNVNDRSAHHPVGSTSNKTQQSTSDPPRFFKRKFNALGKTG